MMIYKFLDYPEGYLLLLSVIINFIWMLYLVKTKESELFSKELLKPFFILAISFNGWILTNLFFNSQLLVTCSEKTTVLLARISNISGGFIIITFFYMSYIIRTCWNKKHKLSRFAFAFILISSLINIILNAVPNLTIKGVIVARDLHNGFTLIQGQYGWLYFFCCIFAPLIPSVYNLTTASKIKDLRYFVSLCILSGVFVCYSTAIFFSMLFPFAFNNYNLTWIPPFFGFIPISLTGYAISSLWTKRFNIDSFLSISIVAYLFAFAGIVFYLALIGLKTIITGQLP